MSSLFATVFLISATASLAVLLASNSFFTSLSFVAIVILYLLLSTRLTRFLRSWLMLLSESSSIEVVGKWSLSRP